jgi:hypothetical protein
MTIIRVYEMLLALYPADFRARFSAEMRGAFAEVGDDRRRVCLELGGLLRGLALEWTAKFVADPADRGRRLPDCRMMRPPGVTRAEWARGL